MAKLQSSGATIYFLLESFKENVNVRINKDFWWVVVLKDTSPGLTFKPFFSEELEEDLLSISEKFESRSVSVVSELSSRTAELDAELKASII
jgi:hypothetical protein